MHTHRGKVIAILLFALVALGGCANLQQKWNMLKSRRAFKQANLAYSIQEYEKAIDFYNTTLELDQKPDPRVEVTTYFYRGSSHHLLYKPSLFDDPANDAQLEAAIVDYEKAIELSKQHAPEFEMLKPYQQYGMEQLAAIYRDNLDDFESAEKQFKSLIEFDPSTPERYYALADVYERFHDPEGASPPGAGRRDLQEAGRPEAGRSHRLPASGQSPQQVRAIRRDHGVVRKSS